MPTAACARSAARRSRARPPLDGNGVRVGDGLQGVPARPAVSEIPIDYYPRTGESKLNRFGDAWRHVRFMLLYSPSWLYLVPGALLLVLGLAGMLVLATGPVDVFGRSWQIHTMLGFVALTLIGAQVIQLGRLRAHLRARAHRRARPAARAPRRPRSRSSTACSSAALLVARRSGWPRGDRRRVGQRGLRHARPRVRDGAPGNAARARHPGGLRRRSSSRS